jgi:hypothetical protein
MGSKAKVFIVNSESQADHKVYFVDSDSQQKNQQIISPGELVDSGSQADVKVFIVSSSSQATIKILRKNFPKWVCGPLKSFSPADGSYVKLLNKLSKIKLLIIDDWGIDLLDEMQRRDLLEIFEDRHQLRSTIIIAQVPVDKWHEVIGEPTIADAILDRIVHNAYQIKLTVESMRKNITKNIN